MLYIYIYIYTYRSSMWLMISEVEKADLGQVSHHHHNNNNNNNIALCVISPFVIMRESEKRAKVKSDKLKNGQI